MPESKVLVQVDERRLTLTNLEKVLYPSNQFTKRDVISYYTRIAPIILPYLADRATTFVRFPNGVEGKSFFEKDVSRHAPSWVRTARLPADSRRGSGDLIDYPVIDGLPALVWAANLAALELHVPQWTVGPRGAKHSPDLLVFDLDPGAPATIVECCQVALKLRDLLAEDDLVAFPKTSGSKGMQLYCAVRTTRDEQISDYAKSLAETLSSRHPREIVAKMAKALRSGKVFVDWSQNNPHKTTIAPYSLRARELPTVSTPLTWDEVESCGKPYDLVFTAEDVLDRVDDLGDLFAGLASNPAKVPKRS
ncbi:non-homologous end-joining DNA ligase [Amycolatopsis sp. cg5]|uniref:non-homologous end-joining DNA ligase n=1 Tax=Amycolatopsis sp. cg5 TaxID=3238802 RepID=UPI0035234088